MSDNLRSILRAEVLAQSASRRVALLLSGGLDSLTVGIACEEAGKEVVAYTYELDGIPSTERPNAEAIARRMRWTLRIVRVPTHLVSSTFLRLAIEHGCSKKTQFEVTYPILYLMPEIVEADVFSGWNKDDHYANTREDIMEMSRHRRAGRSEAELQARFDALRDEKYAKSDAADSPDTFWFASRIATAVGKRLLDPSRSASVRRFFRPFSHDQLSSPVKPPRQGDLRRQDRRIP
jgi:asparagine synthetase B (glutamine-hydrolysing)